MAKHTFTRSEVEAAAQAALGNWDFDMLEADEASAARQNLEDIVSGADEIALDADYPAESKRSTDINDWLHNYAVESGRGRS